MKRLFITAAALAVIATPVLAQDFPSMEGLKLAKPVLRGSAGRASCAAISA